MTEPAKRATALANNLQPHADDSFMHGDRLSLYAEWSDAYVVDFEESVMSPGLVTGLVF